MTEVIREFILTNSVIGFGFLNIVVISVLGRLRGFIFINGIKVNAFITHQLTI